MGVSYSCISTFRDEDTKTLQGNLAHMKHSPPQDHPRSLGIGLLQGPAGGLFLAREVPLYTSGDTFEFCLSRTDLISHSVFIKWLEKVNSPTRLSTNCLLSVIVNNKLTIL